MSSIQITDNWPKREDPFIRVRGGAMDVNTNCDFPYSDSSERRDQLENARDFACKSAMSQSREVFDNTDSPVLPRVHPRRHKH